MQRFLALAAAVLLVVAPVATSAIAAECEAELGTLQAELLEPAAVSADFELSLDPSVPSQSLVIPVGWSCEISSDTCLTHVVCQSPQGPGNPRLVIERCCPPPCTDPPCDLQPCQFNTVVVCGC